MQYSRKSDGQGSSKSKIVHPFSMSVGQSCVRFDTRAIIVASRLSVVVVAMIAFAVGTSRQVVYVGILVCSGIAPKLVDRTTKVLRLRVSGVYTLEDVRTYTDNVEDVHEVLPVLHEEVPDACHPISV